MSDIKSDIRELKVGALRLVRRSAILSKPVKIFSASIMSVPKTESAKKLEKNWMNAYLFGNFKF